MEKVLRGEMEEERKKRVFVDQREKTVSRSACREKATRKWTSGTGRDWKQAGTVGVDLSPLQRQVASSLSSLEICPPLCPVP